MPSGKNLIAGSHLQAESCTYIHRSPSVSQCTYMQVLSPGPALCLKKKVYCAEIALLRSSGGGEGGIEERNVLRPFCKEKSQLNTNSPPWCMGNISDCQIRSYCMLWLWMGGVSVPFLLLSSRVSGVTSNAVLKISDNVMQKGDNCSGLTKSLEHVYRGSVHVVEHNDYLFSWKKYSNYKHVLAAAK